MWEKGRGKLGVFESLLGTWAATTRSEQGKVHCTRHFARVLSNRYVRMDTRWKIGRTTYEELAIFCVGPDRNLRFWSFTSDGKQSTGEWADVSDIHPQGFGFQSRMPGGLARQIFWPAPDGAMCWAVESKTSKGWKRFVEHRYTQPDD
jgi:hypothetical protein